MINRASLPAIKLVWLIKSDNVGNSLKTSLMSVPRDVFLFQLGRRVFKESENVFKTEVSVVKRPAGLFQLVFIS